ncbi:MAG: LysM peptidoglycan-binding domain-containing protein [Anaerolineae bacterium]|nr:LysM peptidoglycan-binding domain-containing protein [Anaerolineae bacterium]
MYQPIRVRGLWLATVAVFMFLAVAAVAAASSQDRYAAFTLRIASTQATAPVDSAQTGTIIHVVQRGETLAQIARRYGVGVEELARLNGVANPTRIFVGQALRIPSSAEPSLPASTPTPVPLPCPCEEIVILSPGRGETITNPVTVTGVASSPFEQTVVVAVLDGSGEQIGLVPGIIVGELGERGPFSVTVPFSVPVNSQPGRIQVFTESPRDGAMEHLSSVTVRIQGLDLDPLLEQLEAALVAKDLPALKGLMGPQFRFGLYRAEWAVLTPDEAMGLLWNNYFAPGNPRPDFSADARRMLAGRVDLPADVRYIVLSRGWGPKGNDEAFLLIGVVEDRARWTGLLYVPRDRIDYR